MPSAVGAGQVAFSRMMREDVREMRTYAPPLLPIFRSQLQGDLLAAVLLSDQERSISEIAGTLDAPVPTVAREVSRLEEAGFFTSRRVGTARLVRANTASPLTPPLTELVLRAFGPATILAHHLGDVEGIDSVAIFGSWAARYHGEPGPPPGDIDVLVIGNPDRDDVYDAATEAERQLGREVNTVVVTAEQWRTSDDPFLTQIRSRPQVPVLEQSADSAVQTSDKETR